MGSCRRGGWPISLMLLIKVLRVVLWFKAEISQGWVCTGEIRSKWVFDSVRLFSTQEHLSWKVLFSHWIDEKTDVKRESNNLWLCKHLCKQILRTSNKLIFYKNEDKGIREERTASLFQSSASLRPVDWFPCHLANGYLHVSFLCGFLANLKYYLTICMLGFQTQGD